MDRIEALFDKYRKYENAIEEHRKWLAALEHLEELLQAGGVSKMIKVLEELQEDIKAREERIEKMLRIAAEFR